MISGEEGREARGNKESFKKYDKPKIVGSATLEIHYVMLVATLIFKQFKLFFNSIFRIYELVDFEQQWLLFRHLGNFLENAVGDNSHWLLCGVLHYMAGKSVSFTVTAMESTTLLPS